MRVAVVGNSGAGKSTFAIALADRLGASHIELDSIHHLPGWQPLPDEEFRERVATALYATSWVVDGNYSIVWDLVSDQAEAVVILAYPRPMVMRRIVARSVRRVVTREELWNQNRERWTNLLSWDPEKSVIRVLDHLSQEHRPLPKRHGRPAMVESVVSALHTSPSGRGVSSRSLTRGEFSSRSALPPARRLMTPLPRSHLVGRAAGGHPRRR